MKAGDIMTIPLFPLNTVLFPRGVVPLRIFEPRYLDMVSKCLNNESGIGVILIRDGKETGAAPQTHETGTLSEISYWHKRNDGMLGITLKGQQRFKVISTSTQPDQLVIAEIELLPGYQETQAGESHELYSRILKQIIAQLEPPFTTMEKFYDDPEWVSARLIELLPFDLIEKQKLLDIDDLGERVQQLEVLLKSIDII